MESVIILVTTVVIVIVVVTIAVVVIVVILVVTEVHMPFLFVLGNALFTTDTCRSVLAVSLLVVQML